MARRILELIIFALIGFVIINAATTRVIVDGPSMEPTVYAGQYLLVSRLHYEFSEPQRGDIVVFHLTTNMTQEYLKRIIGLPGETVELREGQVYINGQLWDESYVSEPCHVSVCVDNIWQVGFDEYFVMGDNRNHSNDSRSFGTIPRDMIVGRAVLRYFPLSELSWLDQNG